MKTYLYDYTNFGVLYVTEEPGMPINKSKWIFSMLRSCILDTHIASLGNNSSIYKTFNNELIVNDLYVNNLTGGVQLGGPAELNLTFIEKRKRAQMLAPLIIKLINIIYNRLLVGWLNEIGLEIYDTLAIEILHSNPAIDQYSHGVLTYADTLGITPNQAYNELKLECETYNSIKLRAYAISRKYINLIRQVTTQEQADILMNEITQKLVSETRI